MFLILFGHVFPSFFPHGIFQDIHPGEALREGQGGPQGRLRAHDVLGAGHEKRLRHPWGRHDDKKKHMVCNYDKFTIVMDVSPIYIYYMFIV